MEIVEKEHIETRCYTYFLECDSVTGSILWFINWSFLTTGSRQVDIRQNRSSHFPVTFSISLIVWRWKKSPNDCFLVSQNTQFVHFTSGHIKLYCTLRKHFTIMLLFLYYAYLRSDWQPTRIMGVVGA